MRVIRSAGQNVSPSDDGRLFDQIFTDGLFEETTITHLGANNVALGAMYGIICGRDFTAEAQTVAVELPEDDAGTTGYIYIEIDTSSDDVITIGSALAPFTPTYEDLNTNGAVAQMIIAEYVASSVAITSLTPVYVMATSGSVLPGSVATVEVSPAVANHAVGDFILYGGQLYSVTAAISVGESLTPGTNISATSAGSELTSLKSGLMWKTASGYLDAYNNAITEIMIVGKGINGTTNIAISMIIPKSQIDTTSRVWVTGDSYNGGDFVHLQANITTTSVVGLGLYIGNAHASGETIVFLYR